MLSAETKFEVPAINTSSITNETTLEQLRTEITTLFWRPLNSACGPADTADCTTAAGAASKLDAVLAAVEDLDPAMGAGAEVGRGDSHRNSCCYYGFLKLLGRLSTSCLHRVHSPCCRWTP